MPLIKATKTDTGDYIFEGMASLPGRDLEDEETIPNGLDIDYLLGKGLPSGSGGFINYDHSQDTIVGVPLDGKISSQGFWLKWKALKTPFMMKIIEQMKALKEAGNPRRYGMSVEGVVKQYDPETKTIKRAFIRNVALTPTPVHPGTWVDFAKSLTGKSNVQYNPNYGQAEALKGWLNTLGNIINGDIEIKKNPYFRDDGTLKKGLSYFQEVYDLPEVAALELAYYALTREKQIITKLRRNNESA